MVENTGLPDYEYMRNHDGYDIYFGKKIVSTTFDNDLSGEGAYIEYDNKSGYYYLFISYHGLNALGGYNIREYRSENPDGMGNSALEQKNTGAKLFGSYKFDCLDTAYLSAGHSSCLIDDDGNMFQVYHTRFNVGHDGYETRVHQMARTENGWAVVLPFEYSGEVIENKEYSLDEICGEYEFINHGNISNSCSNWTDVNNIIAPTQKIILNSDGTISGLKIDRSTESDVGLFGVVKNGTIALDNANSQRIIIEIAKLISNNSALLAIVAGVILAGILAATMSTADSQLIAASSGVTQDICKNFFKINLYGINRSSFRNHFKVNGRNIG